MERAAPVHSALSSLYGKGPSSGVGEYFPGIFSALRIQYRLVLRNCCSFWGPIFVPPSFCYCLYVVQNRRIPGRTKLCVRQSTFTVNVRNNSVRNNGGRLGSMLNIIRFGVVLTNEISNSLSKKTNEISM